MKAGESETGLITENYYLGWVNFGRLWWVNFQRRLTARTELLLKMGAPANCQRSYGRSPLMQAACRAHLDLVKLLLRFGADPAYQDHEGQTALSEMATCVPGLKMTELLFGEEYAEEVLGKERLMEIKAAQGEIERLMINKIANI